VWTLEDQVLGVDLLNLHSQQLSLSDVDLLKVTGDNFFVQKEICCYIDDKLKMRIQIKLVQGRLKRP